MSDHKIIFYIEQDEDGYPPFGIETVWASTAEATGTYVIDNIPFFARQATLGDVVKANRTEAGLVFEQVITRSPNSLLRVVVHDLATLDTIRSELKALGCSSELFQRRLLAVNVPGEASLTSVQDYLADLERREVASYEEPILRQ